MLVFPVIAGTAIDNIASAGRVIISSGPGYTSYGTAPHGLPRHRRNCGRHALELLDGSFGVNLVMNTPIQSQATDWPAIFKASGDHTFLYVAGGLSAGLSPRFPQEVSRQLDSSSCRNHVYAQLSTGALPNSFTEISRVNLQFLCKLFRLAPMPLFRRSSTNPPVHFVNLASTTTLLGFWRLRERAESYLTIQSAVNAAASLAQLLRNGRFRTITRVVISA